LRGAKVQDIATATAANAGRLFGERVSALSATA